MNSQWIDRVAQRLLKRAAHRAPPFLAERLEEEWLAPGPAGRRPAGRGFCLIPGAPLESPAPDSADACRRTNPGRQDFPLRQ